MSDWERYYEAHLARPASPRLAAAMAVVASPEGNRQALDLGFGQGTETLALMERGWRVLAVDAEPTAAAILRSRLANGSDAGLQIVTATFDEVELPPCDLVWSSRSLPFCDRTSFFLVWSRIRSALVPGGVVAVDVWGPHHAWADRSTTVTLAEVQRMTGGLEVLLLEEEDEVRPTVLEGDQRWHAFHILARRATGE
ncbi:MAG TPA: class I SAM-dependent methyltransferase [Acidimicrobiales bacterium]|nr:class I SAM-dependent methyltransferase [Acidimicrobiales bacterium]